MNGWALAALVGILVVAALWDVVFKPLLFFIWGMVLTVFSAVVALSSVAWVALPFVLIWWLLSGCSGDADYGEPPVTDEEMEVVAPTPERDPSMPLCEGETGPEPGDCQTLVYKLATGYCERFSPCSEL